MKRIIFISIFFIAAQQLNAHPAWGIAVDKKRNIYFADIAHNERGSVWKLSNEGKLELLLADFHAHNVSLDADDNLVTAHGEGDHTLVRIGKDSNLDTLYRKLNWDEFFGGNCTYSKNGNIYFVINHYVWKIDPQGILSKHNERRLEWTQTIYVDDDENVYIPEIGECSGYLYKFYPDGKVELLAIDLISNLLRPRMKHMEVLLGITKGCDDNIYIAETAGQRIIKILENGHTETFYKASNGWTPVGIDFFAGDAYILEYRGFSRSKGPRITKITESGEKSVIFNYSEYHSVPEKPIFYKGSAGLMLLILIVLIIRKMKQVAFLSIFLLTFTFCQAQTESTKNQIVGGPCEGCEAIYEYGNKNLTSVDTLPNFKENEPKLKITGTVYQNDGKTPAENVILYIYHTNRKGIYEKKGNETGWAKRHGFIRGWVKTGKDGKYTFYTFRPASYPGRQLPEHIHITVKEPEKSEYYIDDFVFDDDPLLTKSERDRKKNRGGSGLVKPIMKGGISTIERDLFLGLNIPNYE